MKQQPLREFTTADPSLPELVSQNIESIVALHANEERKISKHRRFVNKVTHFFSRPAFLYFIVAGIILWTVPNLTPKRWKLPHFDPAPFNQLAFVLSASSLLVTVGVLIRQDREERLAEQRAQLSLQLSLLSEQKITKLIALIEELRQDLPNVEDRHDEESTRMQQAADPHQVLTVLQETLNDELYAIYQQPTDPSPELTV
jgi:uncharacterized membrane protein